MTKSRTLRFIEYLEHESLGTVVAWHESDFVLAKYHEGKLRGKYRILVSEIEKGHFRPEFLAEEVLTKLTVIKTNKMHGMFDNEKDSQ